MIYDLQKANIWKRISAFLFDFILVAILAVGFATALSAILGYDGYMDTLNECYEEFGEERGVDFFISQTDYEALSDEMKEHYNKALIDLYDSDEFIFAYTMIFNLSFIILIFGTLFAFLVLEFGVPMFLKNGQTLGKKIFGIAVMRIDGVKISGPILFTRAILGKCIVETLLPIVFILMVIFKTTSVLAALIAIAAIFLTDIIMIIVTKTNSAIHDTVSSTVVVDFASQMIFDSPEALLEYKKKIHAEAAERSEYN